MITKFLDFDKIYNFCFNEKIVTPKNLPLKVFVKFFRKKHFSLSQQSEIGVSSDSSTI